MRRAFFILLLFAIPRIGLACTVSHPNMAASSWADVATCYTSANDGDTITVAAGSYTVTVATVITSKYVKIVAGGSVTLTDNICAGICQNITDSLIYFQGSSAGSQQFGALGNGFTIVQGTSIHGPPSGAVAFDGDDKPVLIVGNTFTCAQTGGVCGTMIEATLSRGVVSGNTMNDSPFGGNCNNTDFFVHLNGTGSGWTEVSKFGALDTTGDYKLYVENNTILSAQEGVNNNDGGRIVARFNTFSNSGIDPHGANTQTFGSRYLEVYKNSFVWNGQTWPLCIPANVLPQNVNLGYGSGGGTALILANAIDNPPNVGWGDKHTMQLLEERPWRLSDGSIWKCWGTAMQPSMYTGFPIPYQNGWGYISGGTQAGNTSVFMDREPYYLAGNTGSGISGAGSVADPTIANYSSNECGSTQDVTDFLHVDQEYYKQVPLVSFDGTTGASQGTRAQRPANCTTGVVYWSTDQGSWNTSGSGGQGVLDKCTGTNTWTNAYYTPYTYPHPLTAACSVASKLLFVAQPSNALTGAVLGTVSVGVYDSSDVLCSSATDTITIANKGGTCTGMTLGGTASGSASSGVFTTTNLTENAAGACTLSATASGLTGADSSAFTISAASGSGLGVRLKLRLKGF